MKKAGCLILLLFCLFRTSTLAADTLYLRNGRKIEGQIVSQSRKTVRIKTAGGTRKIARDRLRRIAFSRGESETEGKQEQKRKQQAERRKTEKERREKARELKPEAPAVEIPPRSAASPSTSGPLTPGAALLRSVLLPGLGQYAAGRRPQALLFGGLALAGTAVVARAQLRYDRAVDSYNGLLNPYGPNGPVLAAGGLYDNPGQLQEPAVFMALSMQFFFKRTEIRDSYEELVAAWLALGGVYGWNLFDAFTNSSGAVPVARAKGRRQDRLPVFSMVVLPDGDRVAFAARFTLRL